MTPLAATHQRYLNALTAAFDRGQYRHVADQEEKPAPPSRQWRGPYS